MIFIKKFSLFLLTVVLSFSFINNKVFAQNFPSILIRLQNCTPLYEQENAYTYEYAVTCYYNGIIPTLRVNDYYLVTELNANFRKGLNRNTFSYELEEQNTSQLPNGQYFTRFVFRLTALKSFVDENYGSQYNFYNGISYDMTFYILYAGDTSSIDYNAGYNDGFDEGRTQGYSSGYNDGYSTGYNNGYNAGLQVSQQEAYQRGYNDGLNDAYPQFINKLDKWIVPAIIVVVVAGIFVGYRRERYGGY